MGIKNKLTQQWLGERKVSQSDLRAILNRASPDCHEANLIVEWGIHAIEVIEALETELDHYAHLAGQSKEETQAELEARGVDTEAFLKRCKGIIQEHKSFDQLAEQAKGIIDQMGALYELNKHGTP